MLVSYVDKKKSWKKTVLLTTMHDDVRVTKDERFKLYSLVLHDHTIGGVGVVDLVSTHKNKAYKVVNECISFCLRQRKNDCKDNLARVC